MLAFFLIGSNTTMASNPNHYLNTEKNLIELKPLISSGDFQKLEHLLPNQESLISIASYVNVHPQYIKNIDFSHKNHLILLSGDDSKAINNSIIKDFIEHQKYVDKNIIDPDCMGQFDVTDYQLNKYNNLHYKAYIMINSNYDCQAHPMNYIFSNAIMQINNKNIRPKYIDIVRDMKSYNKIVSLFKDKATHIITYDKDSIFYDDAMTRIADDILNNPVIFDGDKFIIYDDSDLIGLCYTCNINSLSLSKNLVFPLLKKEYQNIFKEKNEKYTPIYINHD